MTRTIVYSGALLAFTACTAMTIAANILPNWVYYVMFPTAAGSDPFWLFLGLHRSCTSEKKTPPFLSADPLVASMSPASPLFSNAAAAAAAGPPTGTTTSCRSFPHRSLDCGVDPEQQLFCSVWRTIGFLMAVAIVAELVTLVGFLVVLCGGRMKRQFGWRVLAPMVAGTAVLQIIAMALVNYLLDHDDRFLVPGWHLGTAWKLCTASWSLAVLCCIGLVLAAYMLPPEDGFDFLDDFDDMGDF